MVGPVLCIIFNHEDRRLLPETTVRNPFNEHAERQIVLSHKRAGRKAPTARPLRVVIRELDDLKGWKVPGPFEAAEFCRPIMHPERIRIAHIPSSIERRNVSLQ